jgi:hypothetical protein
MTKIAMQIMPITSHCGICSFGSKTEQTSRISANAAMSCEAVSEVMDTLSAAEIDVTGQQEHDQDDQDEAADPDPDVRTGDIEPTASEHDQEHDQKDK